MELCAPRPFRTAATLQPFLCVCMFLSLLGPLSEKDKRGEHARDRRTHKPQVQRHRINAPARGQPQVFGRLASQVLVTDTMKAKLAQEEALGAQSVRVCVCV